MPNIKPFLVLQMRPEDETSDDEYQAFLKFGGLEPDETVRIRIEQQSLPSINLDDYSGVIVGGGPYCVSDDQDKKPPEQLRLESELFELMKDIDARDFPFLGACYGIGILGKYLGGDVSKEKYSEGVGAVTINLTEDGVADPLMGGVKQTFRAFAGHKESCQSVPPGATLLASSPDCPVHVIRYKKNIYAAQFHAELDKAGLALRINIYRHAGYFPPEDADMLIAASHHEEITEPEKILTNFVKMYKTVA